jgi:fatty-acyl-CoA synthase
MMANIYEQGLERNSANFTPITPLLFIERSAQIYPNKVAAIHGKLRQTWAQTYERCRRLASALQKHGIGLGDTVAVMLPNTPPMVEAHFGIPMAGAVLNALNTRLDPESIAFMLNHGEAKVVIVDPEFSGVMKKALEIAKKDSGRDFLVIDVEEKEFDVPGQKLGKLTYEQLLSEGDPQFAWQVPSDEWQAICLNYTSGTTGNPKGVVYHHRGAAINAVSNVLDWDINKHPVY